MNCQKSETSHLLKKKVSIVQGISAVLRASVQFNTVKDNPEPDIVHGNCLFLVEFT